MMVFFHSPSRFQCTLCCVSIASSFLFLSSFVRAEDTAELDWPLHPYQGQSPPAVVSSWVRNDVDAFVLRELQENQLQPATTAGDETLIRRLYFDLIGLPPSPEDIQRFMDDRSRTRWEDLVERLLEDPRYGERWARLWLDLARYADTAGYEGDPDLPHAWRYRDYVIDAFNSDKPYDEFIKEQIAGDEFNEVMGAGELPGTEPENVVALTFLRLAPFTEPRGDETRHEMLSEMTSTVGSVFLGLTVGCAKCHDHKYDDIPTKDFYRLKAFFATVSIPRPAPGDIYQIGGPIAAAFYREKEADWAVNRRAAFEKEIEQAKVELEALRVELSKKLEAAGIDKEELEAVVSDVGKTVLSAPERQRFRWLSDRERLLKQQIKRLNPVAMSLRHSYGPPFEPGVPTTRVMIRGEYDNPGDVVEPGFLSCISGNDEAAKIRLDPFKRWPTRSRRMALAEWIASPDNPMTARVMVNRLWHWHFGRGMVPTPSDFGELSGGPSHPELIDWLAEQFVENKWSIKAIHRLIVNSATYQQTSLRTDPAAANIDPDNTLLWRFRRRRLDAESIRDAVLAVSDRLNPEQHGLPIFPLLPGDLEERVKYNESKWNTQTGPESRKRSIYIYQQRTLTMPLLQAFDALVCDESRPRRSHSVTPLQALAMYNGRLVNEEVVFFADRVHKSLPPKSNSTAQATRAVEIAFGRTPSSDELVELAHVIDASKDGLQSLCRVLLNSNEFVYVD
jgi:hypothetical protein